MNTEQVKKSWAAITGLTFLIGIIVSIDRWIVHFIRNTCSLVQCPPMANPLAMFHIFSQVFSFFLILLGVVLVLRRYAIFNRLTTDKWVPILFINGNGLWLYTVVIGLLTRFYSSDLSAVYSGSIHTVLGILFSFNDFMAILAKFMLIIATTRFLLSIKPTSNNFFSD